jgi:predicted enzyme related to lactoylglutathione lyase
MSGCMLLLGPQGSDNLTGAGVFRIEHFSPATRNQRSLRMNNFEGVTPILNVRDVALSIDYYVNKLGFTKRWDWGAPPTFGSVGRDKVSIFLCQGAQGRPGTWMMIFVDNVDELHRELKDRGAKILQSPVNMPWETREMHVEDPDGHRIRFGSDSTGPVDDAEVKRFWDEVQFSNP